MGLESNKVQFNISFITKKVNSTLANLDRGFASNAAIKFVSATIIFGLLQQLSFFLNSFSMTYLFL